MRTTPLKILASLALALLAPPVLQAQTSQAPAGAMTARVIVKFKADSAMLRQQSADVLQMHAGRAQALGARVGLPLQAGHGVAERTQVVFASGLTSAALAQRLSSEKDVEYAVPDRRKSRRVAPNDPLYTTAGAPGMSSGGPVAGQWYLRAPNSVTVSAINAEGAWDVTTGSASMVVAVLDTGVRFDHPDLSGKLLGGYDFVGADRNDSGVTIFPNTFESSKDGNGVDPNASDEGDGITLAETTNPNSLFYHCTSQDDTGQYLEERSSWHGTQVSGLIGALTNNGTGMASVGRNVRVLPVRVLSKCGGWDSDITAGMLWAAGIAVPGADPNPTPAKVLNLSLGGSGNCSALYTDIVGQVNARGAVIVASAGNGTGHAVSEPANCDGVIGVAGLRHAGSKVGYSDIGPEVSISAPAGNCVNDAPAACLYPILTTSNNGAFNPVVGAGGAIYTDAFNVTLGTSFSAPLVAGTAALMLSVRPDLSPAEVRRFLRSSARAFPSLPGVPACHDPNSSPQVECNCTTTTCGAGMLDAATAVTAAANDPIVRIDVTPAQPAAGTAFTLTSAQTAVVAGRSIASYNWTLVSGGGI
ncbi:MAG TPA: S8 family peptidase, partial [Piscinibacter sp.]|nr:S8 family peptidase [Piscinibacter sp.]